MNSLKTWISTDLGKVCLSIDPSALLLPRPEENSALRLVRKLQFLLCLYMQMCAPTENGEN